MPSALTPDLLYKRAVHYLERYAASRTGVQKVLQRSIRRHERRGEAIPPGVNEWIEQILTRLERSGYLDDRLYAESKIASLRRAGASAHRIREKMAAKGVDPVVVLGVLGTGEEAADEMTAALAFARRRRLGPYATAGAGGKDHNRQLATLARAGFNLTLARRILSARNPEELERMLAEG